MRFGLRRLCVNRVLRAGRDVALPHVDDLD